MRLTILSRSAFRASAPSDVARTHTQTCDSLCSDAAIVAIAICAGAGTFYLTFTTADFIFIWRTGALEGLDILDSLAVHLMLYLAIGACACGVVVGAFAYRSSLALVAAIGGTMGLASLYWWDSYHMSSGEPLLALRPQPIGVSLGVPMGWWLSRRFGLNRVLGEWLSKPWTWRLGIIELAVLATAVTGAGAIAGPIGDSPNWRFTAGRAAAAFIFALLKLEKRL